MRNIFEYIQRNTFENKINNIIFDLDEESLSLLDDEFITQINENKIFSLDRLITEDKYYDKTHKNNNSQNQEKNCTIFTNSFYQISCRNTQ